MFCKVFRSMSRRMGFRVKSLGNAWLNNSKQNLCDRTSQNLKYADMHGESLRKGHRGDVFFLFFF